MLQFRSVARTHVGLVRANNEDSGYAGAHLIMVADGVGGAAAGEVASASVTYATAAVTLVAGAFDPVDVLREAIDTSFEHLRQGVVDNNDRLGMATTMTAVLTDGTRFALGHVGDSRGYLLRNHRLSRITRDHTLVQLMVDEGQISPEEARSHPQRSLVLKSLDAVHRPAPDLTMVTIEPGDRLLLCSDGLSDLVPDDVIQRLLDVDDLDASVAALVDEALTAGGRDNITCIGADVIDSAPVDVEGTLVGAVTDAQNLIDAAAIRRARSA